MNKIKSLMNQVIKAEEILDGEYNNLIDFYNYTVQQYNYYIERRYETHATATLFPLTRDGLGALEELREICLSYLKVYSEFLIEVSNSENEIIQRSLLIKKRHWMFSEIRHLSQEERWAQTIQEIEKNYRDVQCILRTIEEQIYNWGDLRLIAGERYPFIEKCPLSIRKSSISGAGMGVWTLEEGIPENRVLGFYPGDHVLETSAYNKDSEYLFEYAYNDDSESNGMIVDADPSLLQEQVEKPVHMCNMHFSLDEEGKANLSRNNAYFLPIYHGQYIKETPFGYIEPKIACISTKKIKANEEIFVEYSRDPDVLDMYAKNFGFKM